MRPVATTVALAALLGSGVAIAPAASATTPFTCSWGITQRPAGALYQIVTVRSSRAVDGMARVTYIPTGAYVGKRLYGSVASLYTGRHGVPATPAAGTLRVTVKTTVCSAA